MNEFRRSTSLSRYEPASPARRLIGNEDREQLVRFLATRLHHEQFLEASGKEIAIASSGFSPRAIASGPVWQGRGGGARLGLRGCSNLFTGRSNESLQQMGAWDSTT